MNTVVIKSKDGSEQKIDVATGENLSKVLTAVNSPILFGCRTGVCGTCCVNIIEGESNLPEASEDEKEILDLYAEGNNRVRLACQINVQGNLSLEYVGK